VIAAPVWMVRKAAMMKARRALAFTETAEPHQCVLCGRLENEGNNPEPLAPQHEGGCCDPCNEQVVKARAAIEAAHRFCVENLKAVPLVTPEMLVNFKQRAEARKQREAEIRGKSL
jgi:hypothetical protein